MSQGQSKACLQSVMISSKGRATKRSYHDHRIRVGGFAGSQDTAARRRTVRKPTASQPRSGDFRTYFVANGRASRCQLCTLSLLSVAQRVLSAPSRFRFALPLEAKATSKQRGVLAASHRGWRSSV